MTNIYLVVFVFGGVFFFEWEDFGGYDLFFGYSSMYHIPTLYFCNPPVSFQPISHSAQL